MKRKRLPKPLTEERMGEVAIALITHELRHMGALPAGFFVQEKLKHFRGRKGRDPSVAEVREFYRELMVRIREHPPLKCSRQHDERPRVH